MILFSLICGNEFENYFFKHIEIIQTVINEDIKIIQIVISEGTDDDEDEETDVQKENLIGCS